MGKSTQYGWISYQLLEYGFRESGARTGVCGRGGRMETGSWTTSMKSRTALQKGHWDEVEGWKWKKGLCPHNLGDGS